MRKPIVAMLLCIAGNAWSQGGAPTQQFTTVMLSNKLKDPTQMSIAADGKVFFLEREGKVKVWNPADNKTTEIAQIAASATAEDGMLGLALDPGFATNKNLFIYYSPAGDDKYLGLFRYTLGSDGKLDTASKKLLLRINYERNDHSAGGIYFDSNGLLYMGVGDDTYINDQAGESKINGYSPMDERQTPMSKRHDSQRTAANSKDLRGKILRIKPKSDGTYEIPSGNMFTDTAKGLPEIFTMGNRNPFRISVDMKTNILYWCEPGPNAGAADPKRGPANTEEINMAKEPGFYGWPYFIGNNVPFVDYDYTTGVSGSAFDTAHPINESPNNSGPKELPKPVPAMAWYGYNQDPVWPDFGSSFTDAAMAGPIYHFDSTLNSPVKLPKQYDNHFFLFDWGRSFIKAIKLDSLGKASQVSTFKDGGVQEMKLDFDADGNFVRAYMQANPVISPIDMKLGPDGALYVLVWGAWDYPHNTYNGSLVRIQAGPLREGEIEATTAIRAISNARKEKIAQGGFTLLGMSRSFELPAGLNAFEVYSLNGAKVWTYQGQTLNHKVTVELPFALGRGTYKVRAFRK
jgi:cytochrome c